MPLIRTTPLVQLLLRIDTSWPLSTILYCSGHISALSKLYTPHSFCVPHPCHILHRLPLATPGTYVMGNFGKPLDFPLVWTRKGAVEPQRSNWYCAARFTCEKGNFAQFSQSTAYRVLRSYGVRGSDCQFCAKRPHTCL